MYLKLILIDLVDQDLIDLTLFIQLSVLLVQTVNSFVDTSIQLNNWIDVQKNKDSNSRLFKILKSWAISFVCIGILHICSLTWWHDVSW